jgi:hypothetical protein
MAEFEVTGGGADEPGHGVGVVGSETCLEIDCAETDTYAKAT